MSEEAPAPTAEAAPHAATGLPYSAEELRTERLVLRPLNSGDLDDVHAYQKLKDVVRYLHWEVHDHEESAKHLKKRIAMNRLERDGDGIVYAVELPDPEGGHSRVIGDLSLFLKSRRLGQVRDRLGVPPDVPRQRVRDRGGRAAAGALLRHTRRAQGVRAARRPQLDARRGSASASG